MLKAVKLKKIAQCVVLFGVIMQLCLWVIPGTIATRQILLAITVIPSIFLVIGYFKFVECKSLHLLPTILLFCLLLWVVIHMVFFSYDQGLELKQFTSLWLRAAVGIIIGFSLGFILRDNIWSRVLFYIALFSTSSINLVIYAYQSYAQGFFISPNYFVSTYYFKKIEPAYFGAIAIAIAVAQIILLLKHKLTFKNLFGLSLWMLGIAVALTSSLISGSKNGVAIGLYLLILMVIAIFLRTVLFGVNRSKFFVFAISFFFVIGVIWSVHKSSTVQGWSSLFEDIKIAVQIEEYPQWRKNTNLPYPTNNSGNLVAGNTYERFAWATVGVSLIAKHPLGYGLINSSFKKILDLEGINHAVRGQVHSGWIDFGLAYGIPGLLLLFLCLLALIVIGLRTKDDCCFMSAWLALMLIPFCLIAEMSYKQYFESMLFFIALGCSWLASTGIEKRAPK